MAAVLMTALATQTVCCCHCPGLLISASWPTSSGPGPHCCDGQASFFDSRATFTIQYINTRECCQGQKVSPQPLRPSQETHCLPSNHVPYCNSKLMCMPQPLLAGNTRISIVCTIDPDASMVSKSMSMLEIVDMDILIKHYWKEIGDLKQRLEEHEAESTVPSVHVQRLSVCEVSNHDKSKAMMDLNMRIKQLMKLILTSQSYIYSQPHVKLSLTLLPFGGEVVVHGWVHYIIPYRSSIKIDFDMLPYQLHQELLVAWLQLESQANQILSLEAMLLAHIHADRREELAAHRAGMHNSWAQQTVACEEWAWQLKIERHMHEEKEAWAGELVRQLASLFRAQPLQDCELGSRIFNQYLAGSSQNLKQLGIVHT
ncbi:hypothetical protein B0H10DRAFT_1957178 [Mycena sp. CBHHK59/15]|nr:hypothetical protein B0H10DRAFT_1957178 [Mycena sp. CBHHK59/15]